MKSLKVLFFGLVLAFFVGCANAPVTGRNQLMLVPNSTMLSMSLTQYREFLASNELTTDEEKINIVKKVGNNIKIAVENYYKKIGKESELDDYDWEFNVVKSDEINAWCMPGGKIVVYTGLFKMAETEEELAVVIGHEIAHAVARHGNERMSQALITQFGGEALSVALSNSPQETRNMWLSVYGAGISLGYVLPYSRIHEYEADYLGMVFMAQAGYHPYYAVRFWDKMERYANVTQGNGNTPEFLSTHPSDRKRIENLEKRHKEVLEKYY